MTSSCRYSQKMNTGSCSTLPFLTSECPGWVCYAEKTTPQSLPYISTVIPAQESLARILLLLLERSQSNMQSAMDTSSNIRPYIVSFMPCYDKKLESNRKVWERTYLVPLIGCNRNSNILMGRNGLILL